VSRQQQRPWILIYARAPEQAAVRVAERRTPRAMTAIPPMTIHGTPVAFKALARSDLGIEMVHVATR
jgi:hypothetical protein